MLVMACSGLVYGVADVAEDWKLLTMGTPVDPFDASDANTFTRIKLVAISASGIGAAMFLLLTLIQQSVKLLVYDCLPYPVMAILVAADCQGAAPRRKQ